jgi:hypothetical protein
MNYFSEEAVAAVDGEAPHKLFFLRLESKLLSVLTVVGRHDDVAGVLLCQLVPHKLFFRSEAVAAVDRDDVAGVLPCRINYIGEQAVAAAAAVDGHWARHR